MGTQNKRQETPRTPRTPPQQSQTRGKPVASSAEKSADEIVDSIVLRRAPTSTTSTSTTTPLEQIFRRFLWMVLTIDIEAAEVSSCYAALGCSFVLALPGNYLLTSPPLRALAAQMPESAWMVTIGSLGGFQLIAVFLGGQPSFYIKSPEERAGWHRVRLIALILSVGIWVMIGGLLTGGGSGWAAVLFGGLALGCFWACCRLGRTIRVDDEIDRLRKFRDEIKAEVQAEVERRLTDAQRAVAMTSVAATSTASGASGASFVTQTDVTQTDDEAATP